MATISLCMIVKDEEATLSRCLDSVCDIVDEIIIVDTGSCDQTINIAKQYTNLVKSFTWNHDFSQARNFSFSFASKDFIMWLDADDVILESDRAKLISLKKNLSLSTDVIVMKYDMCQRDGSSIYSTFLRERIIRRECGFKWCDPVHERIEFYGEVIYSDISITHKKLKERDNRNLLIFNNYISEGNKLSGKGIFYFARELFTDGQLDKAKGYYEQFLLADHSDNMLTHHIDALIDLSNCYYYQGDREKALQILLDGFKVAPGRAEIICRLGQFYKEQEEYEKAIQWFVLASSSKKPSISWHPIRHQYWDYIPYNELVSCYYKLGYIDKAIYYNEKASETNPDSSIVLNNRVFLANMKQGLVLADGGLDEHKKD